MWSAKTRECTEVYFHAPPLNSTVTFGQRNTTLEISNRPGIFHSVPKEKDEISNILERLLVIAQKTPAGKNLIKRVSKTSIKTFKERVNEKRKNKIFFLSTLFGIQSILILSSWLVLMLKCKWLSFFSGLHRLTGREAIHQLMLNHVKMKVD